MSEPMTVEQGGHGDHDRFPGQRAVGKECGGQHGAAAPDREQPGKQAGGGQRLAGVLLVPAVHGAGLGGNLLRRLG